MEGTMKVAVMTGKKKMEWCESCLLYTSKTGGLIRCQDQHAVDRYGIVQVTL